MTPHPNCMTGASEADDSGEIIITRKRAVLFY